MEEDWWNGWLAPKPITIYAVIKESKVYFLYEGGSQQLISSIHSISPKQQKQAFLLLFSFH